MMKEVSGIDNPTFTKEQDYFSLGVDRNWENTITYSWNKVNAFARPEKGPFKGKHRLKEEKQILKDVSGVCKPGELVAIMGASGAGKTTLLNVLTSRTGKRIRVEGDLFLNGKKMNLNDFTKRSAYVQQEDLFIGTMTVLEQLTFQANLRMDSHIPKDERMLRVEQVMIQLGLTECRDTMIGIEGRIKGISGGETKRLAFACEVLTDPPLMFCDEPTSGLDSFMAETIVNAMKKLAGVGKTIITTIHQPSSEVFAMFDRVLLMAEGRLAYLGMTSDALKFFSGLGKTCPFNYNPADFFISTLAIRPEQEEECQAYVEEVCNAFRDSQEMRTIAAAVEENMTNKGEDSGGVDKKKSPYKATTWTQMSALTKRAFLEYAREPMLLRITIIQTIMVSLLVGLIYLDTSGTYNQNSVQNISGVLFILLSNLSFQGCFGVINTFCTQLPIFLREHNSGMYTTFNFFLTKNLSELPTSILMPFLFTLVLYFMANLYRDVSTFFIIVAVIILSANAGLSFGYLISCTAKDIRVALAIAAPLLIPFMLFGGYFLNPEDVPVYFIWLQYISWFYYGFEALMIAQWREIETIDPVDGNQYYTNGTSVITGMGYNEDHLWFDFVALFVLIIAYRVLAYLVLLRRTYVGI